MKSREDLHMREATHRYLILLLKEYARLGYEHAKSGTNEQFEALWREAFSATERESVVPAKRY